MSQSIIGIDVSKKTLSIALILAEKRYRLEIPNDTAGFRTFSKWLKQHKVDQVKACMEATSMYGVNFANYLYEQEHAVSVVNPVCIHAFAKSKLSRHKTDQVDSMIIAEYASCHQLRAYRPKDPVLSDLKDLYQCLQHLKGQQQQIKNFLENKAHLSKQVCKTYNTLLSHVSKQMARTEHLIDELIEKNKALKEDIDNILTIPGVGKITAVAVLAQTPDFSQFKTAREIAAFAGLIPKHCTSGSSINKPSRLSKVGSKDLRKALYFPAIVAKKHNQVLKAFADKMKRKGKPTKVIIIAIMRKLLHIIFGVVKNKSPFNPALYGI